MSSSKKSALIATFASLLCLAVITLPSTASAYSAAGDFSIASNPNGAWSYGYSSALGSALILYTYNTNSAAGLGIDGWLTPQNPTGAPNVLYNNTAGLITNNSSVYQPGQLILQPGAGAVYCVVRWTAPSSGTFSISATFLGISSLGDSSDVHVLLDGSSIFDANVLGSPSPQSYSGSRNLVAGDTIDFVSGVGSDGSPAEDNTGLSATIVPEPSTVGLVGMAFGCLLSLHFLKRR